MLSFVCKVACILIIQCVVSVHSSFSVICRVKLVVVGAVSGILWLEIWGPSRLQQMCYLLGRDISECEQTGRHPWDVDLLNLQSFSRLDCYYLYRVIDLERGKRCKRFVSVLDVNSSIIQNGLQNQGRIRAFADARAEYVPVMICRALL